MKKIRSIDLCEVITLVLAALLFYIVLRLVDSFVLSMILVAIIVILAYTVIDGMEFRRSLQNFADHYGMDLDEAIEVVNDIQDLVVWGGYCEYEAEKKVIAERRGMNDPEK